MRQDTRTTQTAAQPYMACDELDLNWEWDTATYGSGREGLRAYIEKERPHLLRAYDADFLVQAVETSRARMAVSR